MAEILAYHAMKQRLAEDDGCGPARLGLSYAWRSTTLGVERCPFGLRVAASDPLYIR